MTIDQDKLETIFKLELRFNSYRAIIQNPFTSEDLKEHCNKSFEDFKPFIENFLKQMDSFHQKQV